MPSRSASAIAFWVKSTVTVARVASAAPVGDLVDEAVRKRRPEGDAGSVEPDLGAADERHPQPGGERDAVARRHRGAVDGGDGQVVEVGIAVGAGAIVGGQVDQVEGSDVERVVGGKRCVVGAAELRRPEDHVALAGVVLAVRIGARGPDDQVVDAVAVDVARARDRDAAVVVRVDPVEAEAVRCRRARRDRGSPRSRRPCRRRRSSRRRSTRRPDRRAGPDDQVVDAVAVDVARARDRGAAVVVRVDPVEAEAVRCRRAPRDRGSPRSRRRCRRRRSSRRRRTAVRIGVRRPDDQVVDAVAVDVARARDREAAVVVRVDPVEAEAVRCRRARRDRGSPRSRRRCRTRRSSRRRRTSPSGIGATGPDDQVVDAVAVDVARARRPRSRCSRTSSIPSRRKPFAAVERGEIEARREAGGGAEDDVALAGVVLAVRDRRTGPR